MALTNVTLKYGLAIADKGLEKAAVDDASIMSGINVYNGECTYNGVAKIFDIEYKRLNLH
jgi:alanine dehydrogenase